MIKSKGKISLADRLGRKDSKLRKRLGISSEPSKLQKFAAGMLGGVARDEGNQESQWVMQDIELILKQLNRNPFLAGVHLKNVAIGTSQTLVAHGLQREFKGFIITRSYGDARLWATAPETYNKKLYIGLTASGTVRFDLWVF